jgi:hypothetical protein
MKSKFFVIALGLSILFSCSNEKDLDQFQNPSSAISQEDKTKSFTRFAEILSNAVYEHAEVRNFLKSEALAKIDNDYNVFYPIAKDKMLSSGGSFRDMLVRYSSESEIRKIEQALPLLNIHIPEIAGIKVANLETTDEELPVLYKREMYFKGSLVDSLAIDEVPGFAIFVVGESGSILKKDNSKKVSAPEVSLNSEYEYVHRSFSSHLRSIKHKTEGVEKLTEKYFRDGGVPKKDFDPILLAAYRNSVNNRRATRAMVYYGMTSPNQTPGELKSEVKDCIFRFKISGKFFSEAVKIATANGATPMFNGSTSNQIHELTREDVVNRLMTGIPFCFVFRVEGFINNQIVTSEGMTVYANPSDMFNLYINKSRRHPTLFRHTKYTYSINMNLTEPKWYYPLDNDHDTRLNDWDIASQPITKRVTGYLVNPRDGQNVEVTDKYSVTYVTSNEFGVNISGKYKEIINVGITGKLNNSTTKLHEVTSKYTIKNSNYKLDEFDFNFFNDFPINSTKANGDLVIPYREGKGILEMSIIPITDDFFTTGRFQ